MRIIPLFIAVILAGCAVAAKDRQWQYLSLNVREIDPGAYVARHPDVAEIRVLYQVQHDTENDYYLLSTLHIHASDTSVNIPLDATAPLWSMDGSFLITLEFIDQLLTDFSLRITGGDGGQVRTATYHFANELLLSE